MTTTSTPSPTGAAPSIASDSGPSADEWAKEAEGTIDQHMSTSTRMVTEDRSNATTPGHELPGAFPGQMTPETSSAQINLGETAKHTAEILYLSAHHTVEDVYMTAQHGAESVYATAEHTARQYLPTSVVDKLEGVGVLRDDTERKDEASRPTRDYSREELGGADRTKAKDGDVVTTGTSHNSQSAYKPSPLSNTTSASHPTPPPDSTNSTAFPKKVDDTNTVLSTKPGTNPFTTRQPVSDTISHVNKNPFKSAVEAVNKSPPSSSIPDIGTLTSPDRDAQAAAHVTRDTATDTAEGTDTEAISSKAYTNGGSNTDKGISNVNPPLGDDLNRTEGDHSPNHGAGVSEVGSNSASKIAVANGSESHTRKPSFVQKMKGEAKAFAEKMKTKTRG